MITEFKSKEQIEEENRIIFDKKIAEMLNDKPGLETERLARIIKNEAAGDDRLYISNTIVKLKFRLREHYKDLDEFYNPEIARVKEILKGKNLFKKAREDNEDYLDKLIEHKKAINDYIMSCGAAIINCYIPLLDKYFTEHEIIQILSGSYTEAKSIKEFYDKKETGTKSLTDSFIMHHIEYRWRRGRAKDFIDCPRWEMPLFESTSSYVLDFIMNNKKAKADMDKVTDELFGDAMYYTTTDKDGNVLSAEKVYQNLTTNELIKDYQGPFISQLKQKGIFDNKTTYRIKRVDNGVYSIIGEDKEVIATIYKK